MPAKVARDWGAVYTGPSDLNVILGVITDFLHRPYNSIEDPLDLWFHNLVPGSVVPAFSVGYSVGMAKSLSQPSASCTQSSGSRLTVRCQKRSLR